MSNADVVQVLIQFADHPVLHHPGVLACPEYHPPQLPLLDPHNPSALGPPKQPSNLDLGDIAPSPISISVLSRYLANYPDELAALELLQGFREGFELCYQGPRVASNCKNLKSLHSLQEEAMHTINKEISLGRVAGPFIHSPLQNLRLSPVGMVPKKDGSFRLIHHLSYPHGSSVNDFIDKNVCTVKYSSFDEALNMLANLGPGALIARLDIKSAFRLLPVHKSDFELLGFKMLGMIFIDKCLPFGCSVSCAKFEKFSTFLEWLVKQQATSFNVVHYLDDFLLAGRAGTQDCVDLMSIFRAICAELGVPLAEEKTLGPTTRLVYLGLEIDTLSMTVRIPSDKIEQLRFKLSRILLKRKVTLIDLQELTGLLNFCIRAIPAGRAFVRRLYDACCGLSRPYHRRRVTEEMRKDIYTWLAFLEDFNGITSYRIANWLNDFDLELFTDSAGNASLGCGAVFGTHWVYLAWPDQWKGSDIFSDITFLELVPITMAFEVWGSSLSGQRVIIHTDNVALVSILNSKTSKSKRVMFLLRRLVLQGLLLNIQFKAEHISGIHNIKADSLSRQQWKRFRSSFPEGDAQSSPIPPSFLHMIYSFDPKSF